MHSVTMQFSFDKLHNTLSNEGPDATTGKIVLNTKRVFLFSSHHSLSFDDIVEPFLDLCEYHKIYKEGIPLSFDDIQVEHKMFEKTHFYMLVLDFDASILKSIWTRLNKHICDAKTRNDVEKAKGERGKRFQGIKYFYQKANPFGDYDSKTTWHCFMIEATDEHLTQAGFNIQLVATIPVKPTKTIELSSLKKDTISFLGAATTSSPKVVSVKTEPTSPSMMAVSVRPNQAHFLEDSGCMSAAAVKTNTLIIAGKTVVSDGTIKQSKNELFMLKGATFLVINGTFVDVGDELTTVYDVRKID